MAGKSLPRKRQHDDDNNNDNNASTASVNNTVVRREITDHSIVRRVRTLFLFAWQQGATLNDLATGECRSFVVFV